PSWLSAEVATQGAIPEPLAARIDPRKALAALVEAVRRKGAEVRSGARVVRVEDGIVATDTETFGAAHIVLAAGMGAGPLHAQVVSGGMGRGVKGQAALLTDPGGLPGQMVFATGLYIVPHGNGLIAVGSTSERDWVDGLTTDEQLDDLIARAVEVCPSLGRSTVVERWAGVRPRAPRPDALLGPVPGRENIWFANGGYKIGIGISHRVGEMTAAMILGRKVELPERFKAASHGLTAL
ncbi:NAD(P)/FAD-dependent oxidoreductase, partial [Amaricoccus tamworthensis]|uniref:NAD(P)/FAD-dependent oxidoreductase n=1 Tax=Amaricoccus tamworthensis TaxID=57002 RepID=UPI003C7B6129